MSAPLYLPRVDSSETEPLTVRAKLPPDQKWNNEEIILALPPQNIHWFDVQSGDALWLHSCVVIFTSNFVLASFESSELSCRISIG